MPEKTLRLTVSTPARTVLEADVDFVLLRTVEGDMGILPGHEPAAVLLGVGILRAFSGREPVCTLAVPDGFATVLNGRVTVLTEFAEPPDNLAQAMEERERERAENKLRERRSDLELQRVEAALRRTLVQMDTSSYSILKGNDEKPE